MDLSLALAAAFALKTQSRRTIGDADPFKTGHIPFWRADDDFPGVIFRLVSALAVTGLLLTFLTLGGSAHFLGGVA